MQFCTFLRFRFVAFIRWYIISETVMLIQDKDVKVKSATVDSAQKQTTKKSGKPAVMSVYFFCYMLHSGLK